MDLLRVPSRACPDRCAWQPRRSACRRAHRIRGDHLGKTAALNGLACGPHSVARPSRCQIPLEEPSQSRGLPRNWTRLFCNTSPAPARVTSGYPPPVCLFMTANARILCREAQSTPRLPLIRYQKAYLHFMLRPTSHVHRWLDLVGFMFQPISPTATVV